MTYLFLKGNGNPYHDPKTGRFTGAATVEGDYSAWLPPSDGIKTLSEAKSYYAAHLRGVWTLVINRKAGLRKVKIDLRENEEHAYTKTVDGQRVFWPERARKMSAILNTLAHPGVVLENGDRDLFVERASAGGHEVVVLVWNEGTRDYRFRSFHYWSREEYRRLTASTEQGGYRLAKLRGVAVQKDETPVRKSAGVALGEHSGFESPPNFPNLHRASLAGSFELGGAHTGIGWPTDTNIGYVADIVKAQDASATVLFMAGGEDIITIGRDDQPMLKAFPRKNDLVEFLSDRQIEAGPLTTRVVSIDGDTVHLLVNDESIWLDWAALEIDGVSHRDGRALWVLIAPMQDLRKS